MGLVVKNLVKSFGDKVAVNDLSFEVTKPGVFGLIGTNGAGKTTTIRNILGIMRPDSGEALWDGNIITRDSLKTGYMPEERGLYMKTKVLEQLVYFGQLRGMTAKEATASANSYMKRLGVEEYANMAAEKLSKGNQQKVQLIATLIHNPILVFLDEPFSGLDPLNTEVLRKLIKELVEEGKYIVMSSHQMSVVEEYCEDIAILHRGTTVLKGNLLEIKAGYGHTKLCVCVENDRRDEMRTIAAENALTQINSLGGRADADDFAITNGDESAQQFLRTLIERGIYPLRYEIAMPSLNEIFIEKVGGMEA